jgi:hypothetical protein
MASMRLLLLAFVTALVGSAGPAQGQFVPYAIYQNPSAEAGAASPDGNSVVAVPGWTSTGSFTVVQYGTPGPFPSVPFENSYSPQSKFFVGGPTATLSTATQLMALSGDVDWFESYPNWFHLWVTATFGGWRSDTVGPRIRLELLDASQALIATRVMTHTDNVYVINPALPGQVSVRHTEAAPPGFRYLRVTMELEGLPGEYNAAAESVSWSRLKMIGLE